MNFTPLIVNSAEPVRRTVKALAYGDPLAPRFRDASVREGRLYRVERVTPVLRQLNLNNPVFSTPQFRAQTQYTLNTKTSQVPSSNTTVGRTIYPTLAKL